MCSSGSTTFSCQSSISAAAWTLSACPLLDHALQKVYLFICQSVLDQCLTPTRKVPLVPGKCHLQFTPRFRSPLRDETPRCCRPKRIVQDALRLTGIVKSKGRCFPPLSLPQRLLPIDSAAIKQGRLDHRGFCRDRSPTMPTTGGSGADRIVGAIRPRVRLGDADYAAMT